MSLLLGASSGVPSPPGSFVLPPLSIRGVSEVKMLASSVWRRLVRGSRVRPLYGRLPAPCQDFVGFRYLYKLALRFFAVVPIRMIGQG